MTGFIPTVSIKMTSSKRCLTASVSSSRLPPSLITVVLPRNWRIHPIASISVSALEMASKLFASSITLQVYFYHVLRSLIDPNKREMFEPINSHLGIKVPRRRNQTNGKLTILLKGEHWSQSTEPTFMGSGLPTKICKSSCPFCPIQPLSSPLTAILGICRTCSIDGSEGVVAKWLRQWIANPPYVGSTPTDASLLLSSSAMSVHWANSLGQIIFRWPFLMLAFPTLA
jgi:hypothetical protein